MLKGHFLHACRDTVALPDGSRATREYVVHPGAVMMIPLLDDGRLVLERQYRYPMGSVMIEFPAGKLDAGEDRRSPAPSASCWRRPATRAREWARAGMLHPVIAYSTEFIDIWFARGLDAGRAPARRGRVPRGVHWHAEELLRVVPRRRADRRQDADRRAVAAERPVGRLGLWTGGHNRRHEGPRTCSAPTATASKAGSAPRTISRASSRAALVECPLCGDTGRHQAAVRAAPEPRRAAAATPPRRTSWQRPTLDCRRRG